MFYRISLFWLISLSSYGQSVNQVKRLIDKDSTIRYPDVILAQFRLETGNGTSRLFKRHHNPFGFVFSRQADYRVGKYAGYTSLKRAIAHFRYWQQALINRHQLTSQTSYLKWTQKHYSRDPEYLTKLNRLLRNPLKNG